MDQVLQSLTERERGWLDQVINAARGTLRAQKSVVGMGFLFFDGDNMESMPIGFKDESDRLATFRDIRNVAADKEADAFILIGEAFHISNQRVAQLVEFEGIPIKNVPFEDVIVIQMEVPGVFLTGYAEIGPERRTLKELHLRRLSGRDIGRYHIEAILRENLEGDKV